MSLIPNVGGKNVRWKGEKSKRESEANKGRSQNKVTPPTNRGGRNALPP